MIDKTLEEFHEQVHVEGTDHGPGEGTCQTNPDDPKIHHNPGQGFIKGTQAYHNESALYGPRRGKPGVCHILHRVVTIDMQIALARTSEVDHTVTRYLIEHKAQKGHTGIEFGLPGAVKTQLNANLGLECVASHWPYGVLWRSPCPVLRGAVVTGRQSLCQRYTEGALYRRSIRYSCGGLPNQ